MEWAVLAEYAWILVVLVALEGILAADNALVIAVMVKHLPEKQRKKALFYGLAGAFVFRFLSLFAISFLVNVWQVQALGAAYLLFISLNHILRKYASRRSASSNRQPVERAKSGFWMTVLKVELADIAFAVDSILAAVALAITLPTTPLPPIGGMDGGQFLVILAGGLIGVILMRFAATIFSSLLNKRPGLETMAFIIVGWVGVKLAVYTLGHPALAILPESFPSSTEWKLFFWTVLILIVVVGWILSGKQKQSSPQSQPKTDSYSHVK